MTMKRIIFVVALLVSSLTVKFADAQFRISLNLNIGSQPDWGPVGYNHAEYYYMPDIDAYYSVPTHEFVYLNGSTWVHATSLPARYSNYDLYNGYKVVVNEPNPWNHAATYRARYASYKGRRGQAIIRNSRDSRYANHWRDNGRGNGRDRYNNDRDRGRDDRGHDRGRGHH